MAIIGKIIGFEITKNKDSDSDVLMLQVELTEESDVQTVELFRHAGVDYNPPAESTTVTIPVTESLRIAIATDDGITPESAPGEYEIYSSDGTSKLSKVKCDATSVSVDGTEVVINGGIQGAARVNDQTAIDATTDPAFFTWMNAVSTALGLTAPSLVLGKILLGSLTVKIG
jgi:hypothetical protein